MSLSDRPPPITTYGKTTNIYLLLSAQTVGVVRGEDAVRSTLFGHRMAHFPATFAMAGSSDTTRFGSLEFPTLPPIGMQVPLHHRPARHTTPP